MALSAAARVGAVPCLHGLAGPEVLIPKSSPASPTSFGCLSRCPAPIRLRRPVRQARCVAAAAASAGSNPFAAQMGSAAEPQVEVPRAAYGGAQQPGGADPMTALLRQRVVFLGNQVSTATAAGNGARAAPIGSQPGAREVPWRGPPLGAGMC